MKRYATTLDVYDSTMRILYGMSDVPMAAEMTIKPTLTELAKPPAAEAPVSTPEKPPLPQDAREALLKIAAGPQPEKTAEVDPNKEKMDTFFTQGGQLLLEANDPRVAIAAIARSTAPTPIGGELRRDVLTMISDMKGDKLLPGAQESLTKLQKDIKEMNLPKTDPARSEFAKFLEDYSREHPDKAIDPAKIEALRTGKQDTAATITQVLQTDTGLASSLWAQLKGDGTPAFPNVATPEGLLTAAGLETTAENTQKARKLYEPKGPHPVMKLLQEIKSDIPSIIMVTGMITMVVSQFIQQEGGGGGH